MGDPVSWLEIRPGWRVLAEDGSEVGAVDEVAGDEERDIFDGLSIATSELGQPSYATADQVTRIEPGLVQLSLGREQLQHPGRAGAITEPGHERPLGIWERIAHLVRRTAGR